MQCFHRWRHLSCRCPVGARVRPLQKSAVSNSRRYDIVSVSLDWLLVSFPNPDTHPFRVQSIGGSPVAAGGAPPYHTVDQAVDVCPKAFRVGESRQINHKLHKQTVLSGAETCSKNRWKKEPVSERRPHSSFLLATLNIDVEAHFVSLAMSLWFFINERAGASL